MKIPLYIIIAIGTVLLTLDLSSYTKKLPSVPKQESILKIHKKNTNLTIGWIAPTAWQKTKKSSMRLGSYDVKAVFDSGETEITDLSIIKLRGDGGGNFDNLNRWRSQVDLPAIKQSDFAKHIINLHGKLGDFIVVKIINTKNPSLAMLGAMIPASGNMIYVKLTGSSMAVNKLTHEFKAFAKTIHFIGEE